MTTTNMNEFGQYAILNTYDHVYYYYQLDYENTFRIDEGGNVVNNPSWENDILMDDLNKEDIEIEFVADSIFNYLLHEEDLRDSLTEEAITRLVNYQMSAILKGLDRYIYGWLRWQH